MVNIIGYAYEITQVFWGVGRLLQILDKRQFCEMTSKMKQRCLIEIKN